MSDELKKTPAEQAAEGDGSPEEKKEKPLVEETTPKNEKVEGEEKVEVSKKKLETLEKDSIDLHGIYDARKKKKLAPKDEDQGAPAPVEEIVEEQPSEIDKRLTILEEEGEKTKQRNKEIFDGNLGVAYAKIKKAHPWATTDESIAEVSKNLNYGNAITEDQIYAKLQKAIQDTYPEKYEESFKANIKKEVIEEDNKINAGDMGGGGNPPLGAVDTIDSKMEATQERLAKDLPPGWSAAKKE